MTSNKTAEARGATIEDAIAIGLVALGARRTDVKIEVLDEGSRGVLGIGKRDAIVRLTLLDRIAAEPAERTAEPVAEPRPAAVPEVREQPKAPREKPAAPRIERQPAPPRPAAEKPVAAPRPRREATPQPERESRPRPPRAERAPREVQPVEPVSDETLAREAETAREVVTTLLAQMGIAATVSVSIGEPDDRGQRVPVVDVQTDESNRLLASRGRVLQALQFLTRAMVAQQMHSRTHVVVDVAGFREQRNEQLEALAHEMADRAVQFRRPIALKPMPPHERRIVHMTLRDDKRVTTRSKGEGERRRVEVIPTQAGGRENRPADAARSEGGTRPQTGRPRRRGGRSQNARD
jgi:spoIIIJ-associated protein